VLIEKLTGPQLVKHFMLCKLTFDYCIHKSTQRVPNFREINRILATPHMLKTHVNMIPQTTSKHFTPKPSMCPLPWHMAYQFPFLWFFNLNNISWTAQNISLPTNRHLLLVLHFCPPPKTTGMYTVIKKIQAFWNFVRPAPEVTRSTVAIIIRVVLLSLYFCIPGISLFQFIKTNHPYIYLPKAPINSLH
jgi:hypothetical protein